MAVSVPFGGGGEGEAGRITGVRKKRIRRSGKNHTVSATAKIASKTGAKRHQDV